MMQEVGTDEQDVTDHLAHTNIAHQLQEAATSNVTQASEGISVSPQSASITSPSLPSPTQLTSPGQTLPPPVAGFVARGMPSKPYVPPELASTPAFSPAPQAYVPSPGGAVTPQSSPNYVTMMTPQMSYVQQSTQPMTPTVSSQMPPDATAAIDLQADSGPMYPAHGEEREGGGGFMGWLNSGIMTKVMEKTKSSVEMMITTLDPGMKPVIYSGGHLDLVVTSTKAVKVEAVCQAFQEVFGRATVTGKESQPSIAPQPIGYTAALKGAEERITNLRMSGAMQERQTAVSIENFIVELLPDKWFDIGCVILRDPVSNIELEVFTQATPVPSDCIMQAQDETPSDYNLRWSGLAVTIGSVIQRRNMAASPSDWHESLTGVSRRHMIYTAAKALAGLYQRRIQCCT